MKNTGRDVCAVRESLAKKAGMQKEDCRLAIVLSGGGARGALQVGALRALVEHGIQPKMLVGTSVGAINAVYLGLHGWSLPAVENLQQVWRRAATAELLPSNTLWLTMRSLLRINRTEGADRLRNFAATAGVTATTRFGDMLGPRVLVVATDLNQGGLAIYGDDPETRVMDAVIGSAAVPPWVAPVQHEERILVDGGLVSNLPVQAAMLSGAREIIALDLHDARILNQASNSIGSFLVRLLAINQHRLTELELELAAAKGIPVHHIPLLPTRAVAFWDFARTPALIETGYHVTRSEMARWPEATAR